MKDNRSLSNYIRSASPALRYCLLISVTGVVILSVVLVYAARLLREVNEAMAGQPDSPLSLFVQGHLVSMAILVFVSFATFLAATVWMLVVLGNRIFGPKAAIRAVIHDMQAGQFEVKRRLRKDDELNDIMNDLVELGQILRQKNPG